jgi:hypothetical protein
MNIKGDQSVTPESFNPDDFFDSTDNAGALVLTDEDAIFIVLDIDFPAQLSAVRDLLQRQKNADQLMLDKIEKINTLAKRSGLNQQGIDHLHAHLQASVYQDAAHSMAAVGMLAPLIESLLCQCFNGIRHRILETNIVPLSSHPRWQQSTEDQWDCHFFWEKNGRRNRNFVKGVWQLAEAVGLSPHLPDNFRLTLRALFEYRNKMFHCGFEWPTVERKKFQGIITNEHWPSDWFTVATDDHEPWIFYMTDTFIRHCLITIDNVLVGVGAFARDRLSRRKEHRDHHR